MKDRIVAHVILAQGGVASSGPITSENISRVRAPEQLVRDARQKLEERGFAVVQEGPTSLSIVGTREQFERVFDMRLDPDAALPDAASSLTVPSDLQAVVSEVVFPTPPEMFP